MKTTRRDFAKTLSVAAALIATDAHAETKPSQADLVQAEFGQYLTAEEMEKIRKDFAESAPYLRKFREHKLMNGDEPDFTFSALAKR